LTISIFISRSVWSCFNWSKCL